MFQCQTDNSGKTDYRSLKLNRLRRITRKFSRLSEVEKFVFGADGCLNLFSSPRVAVQQTQSRVHVTKLVDRFQQSLFVSPVSVKCDICFDLFAKLLGVSYFPIDAIACIICSVGKLTAFICFVRVVLAT